MLVIFTEVPRSSAVPSIFDDCGVVSNVLTGCTPFGRCVAFVDRMVFCFARIVGKTTAICNNFLFGGGGVMSCVSIISISFPDTVIGWDSAAVTVPTIPFENGSRRETADCIYDSDRVSDIAIGNPMGLVGYEDTVLTHDSSMGVRVRMGITVVVVHSDGMLIARQAVVI